MNSPTTEKDTNVLEEFERFGYGYMNRLLERWKGRVYFHDQAKARLGCILGYIIGLKHAGQVELAEKMAEDIDSRMNQLSFAHNDFEVVVEEKQDDDTMKRTVTKLPNRKCVLGDDGTWHGFSLMWYSLLNPEVYDENLKAAQEEIEAERESGEVYDTAHDRVVKKLRIQERLDPTARYSDELTEYRYIGNDHKRFYYVPSFNGGLIYHGPGRGETFTVNLGSGTLWGIHT